MFIDDDHPSFVNKPNETDRVWRYMDLARYLSLLQTSSLHFARADQMADRWEGSYSEVNQQVRPHMYGEHYEAMWGRDRASERRAATLQQVHMNCWHLSEYESAAMWEIYQREGRGVAIQSTWGALTQSMTTERMIYGGRVKYADYTKTFIPEGIVFDAFMHKRQSYAHEREVRLIMLTGYSMPHPTEKNTAINLGPEPPIIPITVDIDRLVEGVFVAPDAPEWVAETITEATKRHGGQFPVRQSDLASDPIA